MEKKFPPILVIDDNPFCLGVIEIMIKEWFGIRIDRALSGNQGLNHVQSRFTSYVEDKVPMYKLIIIDYSMPTMCGLSTATFICNLLTDDFLSDSERESMRPYICCTSKQQEKYTKAEMMEHGVDEVEAKPLRQATLKKLLRKVSLI